MIPRQILANGLFLTASVLFAMGAIFYGLTAWLSWTHGGGWRSVAGAAQAAGMGMVALGLWRGGAHDAAARPR